MRCIGRPETLATATTKLVAAGVLVGLLSGGPLGVSVAAAKEKPAAGAILSTAEELVQEALRAEAAGDGGRRAALLKRATQLAPEYAPARWQSGQIEVGGEWWPVTDAQIAAAADPRQAESRRLRGEHADSLAGQLELARWCRKSGLHDEARYHWATILTYDPNQAEALRALGVRWHNGRLLTYAQADQAKREERALRDAMRRLGPRITKWRRAISGRDEAAREAALKEIRELSGPGAIAAIEEATLRAPSADKNERLAETRRVMSLAFITALGERRDPGATESLARFAVLSDLSDVREAAIDRLKYRPLHDYVPMLLAELSTPVESWFGVRTSPDGSVHYQHSLYREGKNAIWSFEGRKAVWQHDMDGIQLVRRRDSLGESPVDFAQVEPDFVTANRIRTAASRSQQRFALRAVSIEQQVANENIAIATINQRIIPVLANVTGQELGGDPRNWWTWWDDHNEYYVEEKPVYETYASETDYLVYRDPTEPRRTSCFARGTLVWTKTGRRPIETLELGDLVLSQDPDSGRLAYQPVIGRTVRPPSPMLKMTIGDEVLTTTLGHPLWAVGHGWRMAKEVENGAMLHGLHGHVHVEQIAPGGEDEAYNLVVAEFNTYFVGAAGVLVHDNTPRSPTAATVPGLVE